MRKLKSLFMRHLLALLPLRAPSGQPERNLVLPYCRRELESAGRVVEVDEWNNLVSIGTGPVTAMRGVVAHTDAVGQTNGPDRIKIRQTDAGLIVGDGSRPMGADDKIGVAIALALGAYHPEWSVILTADEEIGCVGADRVRFSRHELLVQADRRGASDLVGRIGYRIATRKAMELALGILLHRREENGMMTDVMTLSDRGLTGNAFNMSAGYYSAHSSGEYVVEAHGVQALLDCRQLLLAMPKGLKGVDSPVKSKKVTKVKTWVYGGKTYEVFPEGKLLPLPADDSNLASQCLLSQSLAPPGYWDDESDRWERCESCEEYFPNRDLTMDRWGVICQECDAYLNGPGPDEADLQAVREDIAMELE